MEVRILNHIATDASRFGSSVVRDQENIYVIGGFKSQGKHELYLEIRVFNIPTITWNSHFISSNTHFNRIYHSSARLNNQIYIFGGKEDLFGSKVCDEVIIVKKGHFGYNVLTLPPPEKDPNFVSINTYGHTSNTVGKEQNFIITFGGIRLSGNGQEQYTNDLILYGENPKRISKVLDVDGEKPSKRAFHSAQITGKDNSILIVSCGETEGKGLLNDIWITDLKDILYYELNAEALNAQPVIEEKNAKGKGGAKKGAEPVVKVPTIKWIKLSFDSPATWPLRCKHNSFVAAQNEQFDVVDYYLFGGFGEHGPFKLQEYYKVTIHLPEETLSLDKLTTSQILCEEKFPDFTQQSFDQILSHSFTSIVLFESDFQPKDSHTSSNNNISPTTPLALFLFEGSRKPISKNASNNLLLENTTLAITLHDQPTPGLKNLKRLIRLANKSLSTSFPEKENSSNFNSNEKIISYENGDEYRGEFLLIDPSNSYNPEEQEDEFNRHIGFPGLHFPHGKGVMKYANGDIYEGSWYQGQRHGFGREIKDNGGISIEGQYDHDVLLQGSFVNQDVKYQGQFLDGLFHGQGELLRFSDQEVYRGEFKEGMKDGRGNLINPEDRTDITATWSQDQIVGKGEAQSLPIASYNVAYGYIPEDTPLKPKTIDLRFTFQDSNVESTAVVKLWLRGLYSGPIENGLPSGSHGMCIYEDKSEYTGQWRLGKRNGLGTYIFSNNDKYEGKWVGDRRCGYGRTNSIINNEYDGAYDFNVPHGEGMMKYKQENQLYHGQFKHGLREGFGKLYDSTTNQLLEEGQWMHDHRI